MIHVFLCLVCDALAKYTLTKSINSQIPERLGQIFIMRFFTSITRRSFLSSVFFIQFIWAIKDSEYSGSQTREDTLGSAEAPFPTIDETARNQLIAFANNERRSEQEAWIEEPESSLLAGVDCNSGAIEKFPDQVFEATGISRRRLLAPRGPQRRIPNFCSAQPTKEDPVPAYLRLQEKNPSPPKSSTPGIRNSESSPSDIPRGPLNIEWSDLQLLMPVGVDGEPNRGVCNYELTQVPICTLFDETDEPIFIAQVVTPARLCRFYLLFLPLTPLH